MISGPPPREPLVKKEGSRRWGAIFAVLGLIVLLLGVALVLLSTMIRGGQEQKREMSSVRISEGQGPEEPLEGALVVAKPSILAVPEAPEAPQPPFEKERPVSSSLPEVIVVPQIRLAHTPPTPFVGEEESPIDEEGATGWPRLNLSGVISRGDPASSAAIINGDIVDVGDQIRGVEVLEVETSGVWLEWSGERRFLRGGRTLK